MPSRPAPPPARSQKELREELLLARADRQVVMVVMVVMVVIVVMVVMVVMEVEATICLTMSLHNVQGEDARQMGFVQLPLVVRINLCTA